jgi:hypothetical protein
MIDGATIALSAACTLVGAVIGVAATWHSAWHFARRSSAELAAALRVLSGDNQMARQALNAIGGILEQAGLGKVDRDAAGNIIAITIGSANVRLSPAIARGTAEGMPPAQYDRQHEQPPSPEPEGDHA